MSNHCLDSQNQQTLTRSPPTSWHSFNSIILCRLQYSLSAMYLIWDKNVLRSCDKHVDWFGRSFGSPSSRWHNSNKRYFRRWSKSKGSSSYAISEVMVFASDKYMKWTWRNVCNSFGWSLSEMFCKSNVETYVHVKIIIIHIQFFIEIALFLFMLLSLNAHTFLLTHV